MTTSASVYINRINVDYPQAGRDNDSQGLRDNFRNIFNAFSATNADIESLKLNAVSLSGVNDFGYNTIKQATLQSCVTKVVDYSPNAVSGNVYINYREGNYQKYSVRSGNSTFFIQNWPSTDYAELRVVITPISTATTQINFGGNITQIGNINLPMVVNSTTSLIFDLWTDNGGNKVYIEPVDTEGNINFDNHVNFNKTVLFNSTVTVSTNTFIAFENNSIFIGDVSSPFGGVFDTNIAFGKILLAGTTTTLYGIYSELNPIYIATTSSIFIGRAGNLAGLNGSSLYPAGDNGLYLGTSTNRWISIWSTNGTIQTSDMRFKENIKDSTLGLNFIKDLRPVSFSLKDSPGETHWGLIAQEVKVATDKHGVEFSGWVEGNDTYRSQHLIYTEFIGPLIQSVKDLAEENDKLKKEIEDIKKHLGI